MRKAAVASIAVYLFLFAAPAQIQYPDLTGTTVTLPYSEFDQLLKRIPKSPPESPEPDARFAVNRVVYSVFAGKDQVRIEAALEIEVLQANWNFIPLFPSTLTLASLQSSVAEDRIIFSEESGEYRLCARSAGKRTVKAVLYMTAGAGGTENSFVLPFRENAVVRKIVVSVPKEGSSVSAVPAAWSNVKNAQGRTILEAVPENDDSITISWERIPETVISPRPSRAAIPGTAAISGRPEPKITAAVYTSVSVLENQADCISKIEYKILNTTVNSLILEFPADATIDKIRGQNVADWKEIKKEGAKTVEVLLGAKTDGIVEIYAEYRADIGPKENDIRPPLAAAPGAEREKGWIGISADQNIELKIKEHKNLARVDVSELPGGANARGDAFIAFKYLRRPFELALELKRNEKLETLTSIVDLAGYTSLILGDGKLLTMCSFNIRNTSRQFLKLKTDRDAEVWSSLVNGRPVKPSRNKNGQLLIPLPRGETANTARVEILYLKRTSPMKFLGRGKIAVPLPDIPVTLLMWEVYVPADYDYFGVRGNIRKYDARPAIEGGQVMMQEKVRSGKREVFSIIGRSIAGKDRPASGTGPQQQQITRFGNYLSKNIDTSEIRVTTGTTDMPVGESFVESEQGVLPIQINLPRIGKYFYFQKLMPVEDTQRVGFSFLGGSFLKWGKRIAFLAVLALAAMFAVAFARFAPGERLLEKSIFLTLTLALWLNPAHRGLLGAALIVCAIVYALKYLSAKRKVRLAGIAVVVIAACAMLASRAAAAPEGEVTMPWSDYKTLLEITSPQTPTVYEPPVNHIIQRTDIKARGGDGSIRVEMTLNLVTYGNKPVEIRLFGGRKAVTDFSSSAAGDRLKRDGETLFLVTSGPGGREVKLGFAFRAPLDSLSGNFSFLSVTAPATTLSIEIPGKKLDIRVSRAVNAVSDFSGGGTKYSAVLGPGETVNVEWKRKAEDIRPGESPEARVDAAVQTHVLVSEGIATYNSKIHYSIKHAGMGGYTIELPAEVDILNVSGPSVRDVAVTAKGKIQIVTVALGEYAIESGYVAIEYECLFTEKTGFRLYTPRPAGVKSLIGHIAVAARDDLEISPAGEEKLSPIDPSEVPQELKDISSAPILYAYKYFEQPPAAPFKAAKNESVSVMQTAIDSAVYTSVVLGDGRVLSSYEFELRTRDRQFFEVELPGGSEVWSVAVNNGPVVASTSGGGRVLVPIKEFLEGVPGRNISIEIVALARKKQKPSTGSVRLDFPKTGIAISRLDVSVYVPKEWKIVRAKGNLGKPSFGGIELLSYSAPSLDQYYFSTTSTRSAEIADVKTRQYAEQTGGSRTYNGALYIRQKNGSVKAGPVQQAPVQAQATIGYRRRGALPVLVSIPRAGLNVKFTKFMVLGEKPSLRLCLYPEPVSRYAKYASLVILFLLGAALICMSPIRNLFRSAAAGPLIAALLPLSFIHYYRPSLFWIGMIVATVAAIAVHIVKRRRPPTESDKETSESPAEKTETGAEKAAEKVKPSFSWRNIAPALGGLIVFLMIGCVAPNHFWKGLLLVSLAVLSIYIALAAKSWVKR